MGRHEFAQFAFGNRALQSTVIRIETTLMVDDQECLVLVAGRQHAFGIRQTGGNGLLAIDDGNAPSGTGSGYFGVRGGVRGDADDVEGFTLDHVTPIGIRPCARPRGKTFPSPGVPARPGDKLKARVSLVGGSVGAIQVLHPLAERVTRDLVGAPDHTQTNDRGSIGFVFHFLVLRPTLGSQLNSYGLRPAPLLTLTASV
jgi:hypothetical protein